MAMESGNALEPVVIQGTWSERAGWSISPIPRIPQPVTVSLGPDILVTGHPDGTVRGCPCLTGQRRGLAGCQWPQMFLFEGEEARYNPPIGEEMVVEVKTRGPEAFKRWRTLGAERSHPASVVQAAVYSLGSFGEMRDAVIATMDTGNRTWDYEVDSSRSGWN